MAPGRPSRRRRGRHDGRLGRGGADSADALPQRGGDRRHVRRARRAASSPRTRSTARCSSPTTAACDGTPELALAMGARVVAVADKGYGNALIGGIDAARGRYVIMGDADDSYDFAALDAFVDAPRQGADLVMGNRFAGGIAPGAMPRLHRYVGNPVLSRHRAAVLSAAPSATSTAGCAGFRRDRRPGAAPAVQRDGVRQRDGRRGHAGRLQRRRDARPRSHRTGAPARRTCAAGATAGGTCASCFCTARGGSSSSLGWC